MKMKLTAIHDAQGRIHALTASPLNAPRGALTAVGGQHVTELDETEIRDDAIQDHLTQMVESHHVKFEPAKASLVRGEAGPSKR